MVVDILSVMAALLSVAIVVDDQADERKVVAAGYTWTKTNRRPQAPRVIVLNTDLASDPPPPHQHS